MKDVKGKKYLDPFKYFTEKDRREGPKGKITNMPTSTSIDYKCNLCGKIVTYFSCSQMGSMRDFEKEFDIKIHSHLIDDHEMVYVNIG